LRKIGLFGGTFDPIHTGHLLLAESVLGDAGLDSILFVPASIPPHKPEGAASKAEDRLAMVRLAIDGNPGFRVSDIELRRTGASYTVYTLAELQASDDWTEVEWFLILGVDMLADLPNWRNPDEIVRRAALLVMERPGFESQTIQMPYSRAASFVRTPLLDISSTQIRKRIREGLSIRYWVPADVDTYIREKGLYRT
jgi:nicotinate-nucleotide adenylyltransferase